jgi:hypothetical protein
VVLGECDCEEADCDGPQAARQQQPVRLDWPNRMAGHGWGEEARPGYAAPSGVDVRGAASPQGGVGLVFRKDADDGTAFLIVDRVVPGGPAARAGMILEGDRLVKIDGVELGSAEQSPQLPGPHGTDVTLAMERPLRGRVFDPAVGVLAYATTLTRDAAFFPDKLAPNVSTSMYDSDRRRASSALGAAGGGWASSEYDKLVASVARGREEVALGSLPRAQAPHAHHAQPSASEEEEARLSDALLDQIIREAERRPPSVGLVSGPSASPHSQPRVLPHARGAAPPVELAVAAPSGAAEYMVEGARLRKVLAGACPLRQPAARCPCHFSPPSCTTRLS